MDAKWTTFISLSFAIYHLSCIFASRCSFHACFLPSQTQDLHYLLNISLGCESNTSTSRAYNPSATTAHLPQHQQTSTIPQLPKRHRLRLSLPLPPANSDGACFTLQRGLLLLAAHFAVLALKLVPRPKSLQFTIKTGGEEVDRYR